MIRITITQVPRRLLAVLALFLSTSLLSITINAAYAGTYYVATNGSDSNPGTLAQPFRTINKGIGILRAGDTLLVRAGTYDERPYVSKKYGTSWDNAITIKAYPGEAVTIKPSVNASLDQGGYDVFGLQATSYVIVEGFILDGVNVRTNVVGIYGDGTLGSSHHNRIKNNEIKNADFGNGVFERCLDRPDSNHIVGNRIFNNGNANGPNPPAGLQHKHGHYACGTRTLIEYNEVFNNGNTGIGPGCETQICEDYIIRYNYVHDNGTGNADVYALSGKRINGTGIFVSSSYRTHIYGNISTNARGDGDSSGIWLSFAQNTTIYNNTLYGNIGSAVYDRGYSTIAKNNIAWQNGNTQNYPTIGGPSQPGFPGTYSNNLTNKDPLFVSPAAGDFRLKAGSPAIDAGTQITEVTYDFTGVLRPQGNGFDIGAYEYVGQVQASRPSAPVNTQVTSQ